MPALAHRVQAGVFRRPHAQFLPVDDEIRPDFIPLRLRPRSHRIRRRLTGRSLAIGRRRGLNSRPGNRLAGILQVLQAVVELLFIRIAPAAGAKRKQQKHSGNQTGAEISQHKKLDIEIRCSKPPPPRLRFFRDNRPDVKQTGRRKAHESASRSFRPAENCLNLSPEGKRMASGLTRNQMPGNRLRVRIPCPPLT